MDDAMDPEESTERGRVGPLGEEAIAEAEEMEGLPEGARAGIAPHSDAPEHDPSSHGAGPAEGDTLSVVSDTDVPGAPG